MLFQSADPYKLPPRSLATSLILHSLGLAILCWAALPASSLRRHKFHAVLLAPVRETPAARRRILPVSHPPEPAAPDTRIAPLRHALLLPKQALPKLAPPILKPPELEAPPVILAETALTLPHAEPAAFTPPIKLGSFEKPTTTAALTVPEAPRAQPAGFDAATTGQARQTQRALATGSFDSATTSPGNRRTGSPGQSSIQRASGFGDTQAIEAGRVQRSAVLAANFGDAQVAAPGAAGPERHASAAASNTTVPVEILDKPRPAYTEEARRLSIQGEVLLEVAFDASGAVRVLGVIRGLGHGLDETAAAAARQIHFRPARRGGQPVDSSAIVHIIFQLAQ